MKQCPLCGKTFDNSWKVCLYDKSPLRSLASGEVPEAVPSRPDEKPVNYFRSNAIIVVVITLLCGGFYALISATPRLADKVHSQITTGMRVDEVAAILSKYHGFHNYVLKIMDRETKKKCDEAKPAFDDCIKTDGYLVCAKKFKAYLDSCEPNPFIKLPEFVRRVNETAGKNADDAVYEPTIYVCFMGPGFLHNTFEIMFDREGKVATVTPVKRWD